MGIFSNAEFLREFCDSVCDYCGGFWVQMIVKSRNSEYWVALGDVSFSSHFSVLYLLPLIPENGKLGKSEPWSWNGRCTQVMMCCFKIKNILNVWFTIAVTVVTKQLKKMCECMGEEAMIAKVWKPQKLPCYFRCSSHSALWHRAPFPIPSVLRAMGPQQLVEGAHLGRPCFLVNQNKGDHKSLPSLTITTFQD